MASTAWSHRLLLWLALLLGVAGTDAAAQTRPLEGRALERAIDAYVGPAVRSNNFAGVVLVARGDRILFQRGYGLANIEHRVPHRPETRFHVASVSKPFTAAAIMLLAERGAIDLRAPLSRILPGYPNGELLTVHHLLSHTSGIPNINNFDEYEELQYHRRTPEQLVALFRDRPLRFEPGTRYEYSNSNYNLLAHIIERVSSVSFGDFLQREIFARLGLGNSGHPTGMDQIVPGLADGYAVRGMRDLERARYIDWSIKIGNGSLYTSAADIVRFFRAVHGGRLLDPASLTASFTAHTPNVGYGWFLTRANNRELHHINGRQPGWAAQADYYVADGVSVIVLSNTYSSITTPIARAIGALYFGERHQPLPAMDTRLSAAQIAPLLGAYQFGPDYPVPNALITIVERGGDLYGELAGQPPFALIPTGNSRFIIRPFWVDAEFALGADGRASELRVPPFTGRRVP